VKEAVAKTIEQQIRKQHITLRTIRSKTQKEFDLNPKSQTARGLCKPARKKPLTAGASGARKNKKETTPKDAAKPEVEERTSLIPCIRIFIPRSQPSKPPPKYQTKYHKYISHSLL
jgi:hypothetical protein